MFLFSFFCKTTCSIFIQYMSDLNFNLFQVSNFGCKVKIRKPSVSLCFCVFVSWNFCDIVVTLLHFFAALALQVDLILLRYDTLCKFIWNHTFKHTNITSLEGSLCSLFGFECMMEFLEIEPSRMFWYFR